MANMKELETQTNGIKMLDFMFFLTCQMAYDLETESDGGMNFRSFSLCKQNVIIGFKRSWMYYSINMLLC